MISDECRAHGLGAVSLRYFNVAGASGELGEDHEPETHLIPLVLQAAAGKREHVSVFGTDYPTEDGTAVRDYIHIEDLGEAHILGLERATNPGEHRIYNLGNGTGFSVRQVIEAARAVTGREIPVKEEGRRPGDPAALVASSQKIRDELGWVPRKPGIETMIADAWAWFEARPEGYALSLHQQDDQHDDGDDQRHDGDGSSVHGDPLDGLTGIRPLRGRRRDACALPG